MPIFLFTLILKLIASITILITVYYITSTVPTGPQSKNTTVDVVARNLAGVATSGTPAKLPVHLCTYLVIIELLL